MARITLAAVVIAVTASAVGVVKASAHTLRPSKYEALIEREFGRYAETAKCIAAAESAGSYRRPYRINWISRDGAAGERGVFQIIPRYHPSFDASRLRDPAYNIRAAARISQRGSNFSAWTGTWGQGLCRGLA